MCAAHQPDSDDEICPITLETAHHLGADAYRSIADGGRLYSGSALRGALARSSAACRSHPDLPLYRSPWSQRDMLVDAVALGLPSSACMVSPGARRAGLLLGLCLGGVLAVLVSALCVAQRAPGELGGQAWLSTVWELEQQRPRAVCPPSVAAIDMGFCQWLVPSHAQQEVGWVLPSIGLRHAYPAPALCGMLELLTTLQGAWSENTTRQ